MTKRRPVRLAADIRRVTRHNKKKNRAEEEARQATLSEIANRAVDRSYRVA